MRILPTLLAGPALVAALVPPAADEKVSISQLALLLPLPSRLSGNAYSGRWAEEWQPAVFVNLLKGSNAVLKILERFLDAGLPT